MTDVDCKLTVLVAACTLCGFCLSLTSPLLLPPPHSLCRLHGCHIPLVLERSSAPCCMQDLRELRYLATPPIFHLTLSHPCVSLRVPPALPLASSSSGSRSSCTGMRLSPVVSWLLSCSQLLQVDLFSTWLTKRAGRGGLGAALTGQQQGSVHSVYGQEK